MTIEKKINNDAVTLIVSGRLDTQTAPELENELDSILSGLKELTFDFANLEYVSSFPVRSLLSALLKLLLSLQMKHTQGLQNQR